eukprot:CAMPEP_0171496508 /NCGR_PEP_ID=MMETSP0958-20121227/6745_1 /TAXON_ID=87120 /ORGANISM="Aurantiochytrium limacinum, Strain ATCCMYA-1381" /LENGTH=582 /DNA_ID=CAMNT_0012030627 /DNA_START=71 /DNA_END=1819 /DNA_ORIENTATION=+
MTAQESDTASTTSGANPGKIETQQHLHLGESATTNKERSLITSRHSRGTTQEEACLGGKETGKEETSEPVTTKKAPKEFVSTSQNKLEPSHKEQQQQQQQDHRKDPVALEKAISRNNNTATHRTKATGSSNDVDEETLKLTPRPPHRFATSSALIIASSASSLASSSFKQQGLSFGANKQGVGKLANFVGVGKPCEGRSDITNESSSKSGFVLPQVSAKLSSISQAGKKVCSSASVLANKIVSSENNFSKMAYSGSPRKRSFLGEGSSPTSTSPSSLRSTNATSALSEPASLDQTTSAGAAVSSEQHRSETPPSTPKRGDSTSKTLSMAPDNLAKKQMVAHTPKRIRRDFSPSAPEHESSQSGFLRTVSGSHEFPRRSIIPITDEEQNESHNFANYEETRLVEQAADAKGNFSRQQQSQDESRYFGAEPSQPHFEISMGQYHSFLDENMLGDAEMQDQNKENARDGISDKRSYDFFDINKTWEPSPRLIGSNGDFLPVIRTVDGLSMQIPVIDAVPEFTADPLYQAVHEQLDNLVEGLRDQANTSRNISESAAELRVQTEILVSSKQAAVGQIKTLLEQAGL